MKPLLSILIPTYNRAELLKETLESLRHQTFHPSGKVQVLVSNNKSTDGTAALLRTYQDLIPGLQVHHQAENLGPFKNMQFLLDRAHGDFVYLLCDDDKVTADFLEKYMELIERDSDLDLVFSAIHLIDEQGRPLARLDLPTQIGFATGEQRVRDQLSSHHMVMSALYRRQTLMEAGGWVEQVGGRLDCTAFCRVAMRARKTFYIQEPKLHFRASPGSWGQRLATQEQKQSAIWYRHKLDLLQQDARQFHPGLIAFVQTMYRWHANIALSYLEIELGNHRLSGSQVRSMMAEVLHVFPEGKDSFLAYKLRVLSYTGTGWLKLARRLMGRTDPYQSMSARFNENLRA